MLIFGGFSQRNPPIVSSFVCVCVSLAITHEISYQSGPGFFLMKDINAKKRPLDFGAKRIYTSLEKLKNENSNFFIPRQYRSCCISFEAS